MSDIRRQYEKDFGPLRALDPLELPPLPDIQGRADALIEQYSAGASPADRGLPPLWELGGGIKPRPPEGEGGLPTMFGAELVGVGEALAGAGEYLVGQGERKAREAFPGVVPEMGLNTPFRATRQYLGNIREEMYKTLRPEVVDRVSRQWLTLDPTKSVFRSDDPLETAATVGTKLVQAVPSSLATLLPSIIMFRMGASPAAIGYLGASEATISMGALANQIDEEVAGAREEELMQSPRYAELRRTMTESEAREALAAEAQGARPLLAGLIVGAISSAAGRLWTPIVGEGAAGTALQRLGRGAIAEAPQEASQSAVEQYVQNIAAQTYDKTRSATEGVLEATVEGGALGGLIGGGFSVALGRRQRPEVPSEAPPPGASTEDPAAVNRGTPGESFESVFGPTSGGVRVGPTQTQGDLFTSGQSAADAVDPAVAAALRAREQFTTRVAQPYDRSGNPTGRPVVLQDSGELQAERDQAAMRAAARAQAEAELAESKPKPVSPKAPKDAKARVAAAQVRWQQAVEARTQQLLEQGPQIRPPAAPNEAQVDMFAAVPSPEGGFELSTPGPGTDPYQMALRQGQLGLPRPPPGQITEQRELTQPIPGGTMSLLPPARGQLPQPPERDLSQPPGVLPDERQIGIFDQAPFPRPEPAPVTEEPSVQPVEEVAQPDETAQAPVEYEVSVVDRDRQVKSRKTFPTLAEAEAAAKDLRSRAKETGNTVMVQRRQRSTADVYRLIGRDEDGNVVVNEPHPDSDSAQAALARYIMDPEFNTVEFSIVPTAELRKPAEPAPKVQQPDEPTAEPLLDIEAQLDDMEDETSDRLGVYLSRDNIDRLNRDRASEVIRGRGVQLGNFDDKGGLLIVRDRPTADMALELKAEGQDMQEILGLLTRAGAGKPLAGRYVVQERTPAGAVVRETLVGTYAEADALAEEIGERAVIISAQQALRRRARLIEQERKQRAKKRTETKARDKFLEQTDTLVEKGVITPEEEQEALKSKTPGRAASRLLSRSAKAQRDAANRRIGGFFAPEDLTFRDDRYADLYANAFEELRGLVDLASSVTPRKGAKPRLLNIYELNDVEGFVTVGDRIRYAIELERLDDVLDTLSKARKLGGATQKVDSRPIEVASELSPEATTEAKTRQLDIPAGEDVSRSVFDTVDLVPEDELVRLVTLATRPGLILRGALPSEKELAQDEALFRLDELFAQAVNYIAGLPRRARAPEDAAARVANAGNKVLRNNDKIEEVKKQLAALKGKKKKSDEAATLEAQLESLRDTQQKLVKDYLKAVAAVEENQDEPIERLKELGVLRLESPDEVKQANKLTEQEIEEGATAAGEMLLSSELTSALANEGIQFDVSVTQIITGDKDVVKQLYDRATTPGQKRKIIQRAQVMYQTNQNVGRARQARFRRDEQTGEKNRYGFSGQMPTGAKTVERKAAKQRMVEGYYAPEDVEFGAPRSKKLYVEAFKKLSDVAENIRLAGDDVTPLQRLSLEAAIAEMDKAVEKAQPTPKTAEIYEVTSAYSADVLVNFWRVQDETPEVRKKRVARANRLRPKLATAIAKTDEMLTRFRKEVLPAETDRAKRTQLVYALAYLRSLRDYAQFAYNADNPSTPALNQIEDLIGFLDEVNGMSDEAFAAGYAKVTKASLRGSLRLITGDQSFRKFVLDRSRANRDAALHAKHVAAVRLGRELTDVGMKKSMYFRDMVMPVMQKFADSFMVDGWFSYQPTVAEMDSVQYALQRMLRDKRTPPELTQRTAKYFMQLGYTFDENGVLQYEESSEPPPEGQKPRRRQERYTKITDENLDKQARLKHETLLGVVDNVTGEEYTPEVSASPLVREGTSASIFKQIQETREVAARAAEREERSQTARDRVLNSRVLGVLTRYSNNLAAARTAGAARLAEQRLFAALEELGVEAQPGKGKEKDTTALVRAFGYDVKVPLVEPRLTGDTPTALEELRRLGREMEIPDITAPLPQWARPDIAPTFMRTPVTAEQVIPASTQQQAELYSRVAGVIDRFLKRISNTKTTINGMVRAEQRMVRALQALGVWQQGKTPAIGTIKIGDKSRSVRLVADALQAKTLLKQQAKEIMLSVKPPAEPSIVTAARRTASPEAREQLAAAESKARSTPVDEETDLFMRAIDPDLYSEEFTAVVDEIDAAINQLGSGMSANDALDVFMRKIPKGHPFHAVAQRLLMSNLDDVVIRYDFGRRLKKNAAGAFVRNMNGRPTVLLKFYEDTGLSARGDALRSYTILHELAHAATYGALRNKPWFALELTGLREHVRQYLEERMGGLPPTEYVRYGLEKTKLDGRPNPIDEFLAEAWTNLELRAILKRVPAPTPATTPTLWSRVQSAWDAFKALVRRVLGLPEPVKPVDTSVLDVIFSMTDELFTGEKVDMTDMLEVRIPDAVLRAPAAAILEKHVGISKWAKRIRDWAVPPLGAMSMEQIRDLYASGFQGPQGNPLTDYMTAYFKRAAENSRLMERAEKIVQRWTTLQQKNPAAAVELSRVATEASLYRVSPGEAVTSLRNKHLITPAGQQRWAELNARYRAMPSEYRQMYDDLQAYYRNALAEESTLILQNALRSVLATGAGAPLDIETFEDTFTLKKLEGITPEKLNEMLGDLATPDMKATINQLARLPEMRQGDYFPLMRYGDFVVYASRETERKTFTNNKEAQAYAATKRRDDPTLDVGVFAVDDKFVVRVTEKEFSTAESRTEAEEIRQRMVETYGADAVSDVQRRSQFAQDAVIQSNSALASILGRLEGNAAAQAAIKNFYLRSLSDSSFRKHEIRRKNRLGVNYDIQHRNFANYAKQSAYYTSQLQYGWQLGRHLRDMDEFAKRTRGTDDISAVRRGDVVNELKKRDEQMAELPDIVKIVRRGTEFAQFISLTTPAYWMTNATQPWMITLPWLAARYGWRSAGAALGMAQNLIKSRILEAVVDSKGGIAAARKLTGKVAAEQAFSVIDQIIDQIRNDSSLPDGRGEKYIAMLTELRRNNVIDLSWIAELRDIAEGQDLSPTQRLLDASRIMAHLTEVNNRVLVAIAAYDLKYNEVVEAAGEVEADRQATLYAKTAVSTTQFNYGGANKPRWFQTNGPLGAGAPLVTQFMQWPQHIYAMMGMNLYKWTKGDKEAKRIFLNVLATHTLAAGVAGSMFQPIKWAAGLVLALFGDDDEPYDAASAVSGQAFDWWFQKNLAAITGSPALAEAATKGIPALLGVDLSKRLSMGSIFMADLRPENADSFLGSAVTSFGGPWVGIGVQWGRGFQQVMEASANGDVRGFFRGLEFVMPKIARDFLRAGRFATEGITSTRGDVLIPADDVSPLELFTQSLGLTPTAVSRFYDKREYLTRRARLASEHKQEIVTRILKADPSERGKLISEAVQHNKMYPDAPISIAGLIQAMRNKREREVRTQTYGANLNDRQAAVFGREADFLR
jgi:hypothetical protein